MYSQHLFSLVLFSGLLLTTASRCPENRDIEPYCTCFDNRPNALLTLLCKLIFNVEVLRKLFSDTGDHPFPILKLTGCYMSYFPASALEEKRVKELTLQAVNLVGLFDRMPEPNHRLNSLIIDESKIFRGMEWPFLKNFNNLTRLYIDGVPIRSLGKEFMDNVPRSLTEIILANNKLSRLDDRVFARFTGLTFVGLGRERIDTLKRSMFPVENVIEALNFRENRISELPNDIFSDMPHLKRLSLEKNLLTTISEPVFKQLGRDIQMDLSGNNIKCDCKVRWILKREWETVLGKCHSPNNFKDKDLVGGITNEDLEYCDDADV